VRIYNALDCNGGNCGINRIASCPEYIQARKRRGWMGCGDHTPVADGDRAFRYHEISLSVHLFYRFLLGDLRHLPDPMIVVLGLSSRCTSVRCLPVMPQHPYRRLGD
jgi:hypothetical protein